MRTIPIRAVKPHSQRTGHHSQPQPIRAELDSTATVEAEAEEASVEGLEVFYAGNSGGSRPRGYMASTTIRGQSVTKCHDCGKEGHWNKDCYKRKANEGGNRNARGSREFTFVAENTGPAPSMGWIIDSGASQHLCGNRNTFSTYTNISKVQEITIADGTKIKANGVGTIEIVSQESSITLKNVWHVPDIGGNLLSVSRMVDPGYTVEFGQSSCNVRKSGVRGL